MRCCLCLLLTIKFAPCYINQTHAFLMFCFVVAMSSASMDLSYIFTNILHDTAFCQWRNNLGCGWKTRPVCILDGLYVHTIRGLYSLSRRTSYRKTARLGFRFFSRSDSRKPPRQLRCRDTCRISERYDHCNIQSRSFEASRDFCGKTSYRLGNRRPRARILYLVKLIGVGVRIWTPNGWLGQIIGPLDPENNPQRGEDSVMTYIYSITPLLHHYNTWQDGCDIEKGPGCALVTLSTWGTRTTGSDKKMKTYQPCYHRAVHTKTKTPSWLLKNRLFFPIDDYWNMKPKFYIQQFMFSP